MSDIAIIAEGLGKKYRIGAKVDPSRTLAESIVDAVTSPLQTAQNMFRENSDDIIWALKDVSFEIKKGQVVGIIGRNGAGKSTLLKILTRITRPTTGYAKIYGRVGSLLEVGTGFHPELTGRENVYLNGAILGMHRRQIDFKFDEIVAFSGVEKFLDTPVKRYSSGMKVRLAFSVAAHLEPDVLLVDEVLAVGDAEFRAKCLGKMKDVSSEGRTVLFVTHSMTILQQLCPEAILLENGSVARRGETWQIVKDYLGGHVEDNAEKIWHWNETNQPKPPYFVPHILRILDDSHVLSNRVRSDAPFYLELEYEITEPAPGFKLGLTLSTGSGELFCVMWNETLEYEGRPGRYIAQCEFPGNLLNQGGFVVGINSGLSGHRQKLFRDHELLTVYIDGGATVSELGRMLLKPKFNWTTELTNEVEPSL